MSRNVHLVGSVPLEGESEVFEAAATILGTKLRRLPDGETGARKHWIRWQVPAFENTGSFATKTPEAGYSPRNLFELKPGVNANDVVFGNLGFADAAIASYAVFAELAKQGKIDPGTRFQVSIPTPLAVVASFVAPAQTEAVEPRYEAALLAEIDRITANIPHPKLAIQWDIAIEFALLEGLFGPLTPEREAAIIESIVRISQQVPRDVELGVHLCYGDAGHKHFVEPVDAGRLVSTANRLMAAIPRPLNWIHLPVPRDRSDDAYFAPLRALERPPSTELYLGLVHRTDGLAGAAQRIAAAERATTNFGIAAECGMGRRPPETIPDFLKLHAAAADL